MKTFALLALTLGCNGIIAAVNAPSAQAQNESFKIESAVMAHGYNDGLALGVARTFKPTPPKIHCVVKLDHTVPLSARAMWYSVNAGGVHNFKIAAVTLPRQRAKTVHFALSLPRPFPVGTYRVDVYLNGKFARSVPYSVAK